MPLLTAKGLSKAFGDTVILEDAELHLRQGEKVGLLGVNGSGKSTILRLLAGIDEFDAGELAWRSGTTRTWLPQNPELDPNWTLEQVAIAGVNRSRAGLEGYERELVAHRLLSEVGVQQPQCLVSAASGGTGRRAALAGALLQEPDLLLLDEPTNHLDVETVEWLEAWLRRFAGAVVLITHDRYFLEQVVDRIIEVRRGQLWSFPGTFGTYLQRRLELEAQEARAEAGRKRRLKEELEWLRRSPKARTTKQKARVQRAEGLMDSDYAAREEISLNIYQGRRLGKTILEAKELSAGYDGPEDQIAVVQDLQLTLAKGWRVGIVGPNGAGKT
ncbi:MAG TPA: ABC transporter ATP-binding protein, partial [Myxococcales bacterium]|nr:ABC transporter ATP-binding protein [Myxococcales bacterium]